MASGYNPDLHHRHTIRLPEYDYRQTGVYFVTLCVQGRKPLWGRLDGDRVRFSSAGLMVREAWLASRQYTGVELDTYVIMPDHLHGIVTLIDGRSDAEPRTIGLAEVIQRFKTVTTRRYIAGVTDEGWTAFEQRLWQRGYYERIVRNENELNAFRAYIEENPLRWTIERGESL